MDIAVTDTAATVTESDLDSLLETLEILSDRSAVADVREAELQMVQGQLQMAQGRIVIEEPVPPAVSDRRPRATSDTPSSCPPGPSARWNGEVGGHDRRRA